MIERVYERVKGCGDERGWGARSEVIGKLMMVGGREGERDAVMER